MTLIPFALFLASLALATVTGIIMLSNVKAARPDDPRYSWRRRSSPAEVYKAYFELFPDSWLPQINVASVVASMLIVILIAIMR